jgi:hypothetical protein
MRKLLFVLLLLVVVVVALGFYRGWWTFSTSSNPETDEKSGHLTIHKDKMKEDIEKAKDQIKGGTTKEKQQEDK